MTMMGVARFVGKLAKGQPFATKELLAFGKRAAIDKALQRMVKSGRLVRLARGVFARINYQTKWPGPDEIAMTKARAFGKTIVTHGLNAMAKLELADSATIEPTFATNGRTSSFGFAVSPTRTSRIHFKATSPAKVTAGDSPAALVIRALAQLGKSVVNSRLVAKSCDGLRKDDRHQLKEHLAYLMPGWMSDAVAHFGSETREQSRKSFERLQELSRTAPKDRSEILNNLRCQREIPRWQLGY